MTVRSPELGWYIPYDLYDTDDDWEPDPACPPELLTAGWWSASSEMIEGEE